MFISNKVKAKVDNKPFCSEKTTRFWLPTPVKRKLCSLGVGSGGLTALGGGGGDSFIVKDTSGCLPGIL